MPNEVSPAYVREHERVLERALSLPLPDAVFEVVHYNDHNRRMGPPPHCEAIPLRALASKGTPEQLDEWVHRAASLRNAAFDVGDARLRRDGSYERALARFKAAHPGFGEQSYERVVGYGIYLAR